MRKKFPDFRCRNLLIKIMQNDYTLHQDIKISRQNYTLSQFYIDFPTKKLYKMIIIKLQSENVVILFRA